MYKLPVLYPRAINKIFAFKWYCINGLKILTELHIQLIAFVGLSSLNLEI